MVTVYKTLFIRCHFKTNDIAGFTAYEQIEEYSSKKAKFADIR